MDEAIGTLGLEPSVFWLLTWSDFLRLNEANLHKENQHWDRTRYQSAIVLNSSMGRKKIIRPKDLFSLPHDKLLQKKATEAEYQNKTIAQIPMVIFVG